MTRCNGCFAVVLAHLTAFTLGLVAPTAWSRDAETSESFSDRETHRKRSNIEELGDARIKFEINATAQDGGVQVFTDAELWKTMSIFDPNGQVIFRSTTKASIGKQGSAELFLESPEPEFSQQSFGRTGYLLVATVSRKVTGKSMSKPLRGYWRIMRNNTLGVM